MALFTFYPAKADGTALAFEAHELGNSEAAAARAIRVLEEHPSAVAVTIWLDEEHILTLQRGGPIEKGPGGVLPAIVRTDDAIKRSMEILREAIPDAQLNPLASPKRKDPTP